MGYFRQEEDQVRFSFGDFINFGGGEQTDRFISADYVGSCMYVHEGTEVGLKGDPPNP
jgi:hypothetical protein